jgi:hypothetical protein
MELRRHSSLPALSDEQNRDKLYENTLLNHTRLINPL